MGTASPSRKPSPDRIFGVLNAFQSSAARKTAQHNPNAHIAATDWAPLLAVAMEKCAGGSNRPHGFPAKATISCYSRTSFTTSTWRLAKG